MHRKVWNKVRNVLQVYSGTNVRKKLWDSEFSSGRWDCLDTTEGDCVYKYLEKHVRNGSILDLGCGSGSTGNELADNAYREYLGVDISEAALLKARKRSEDNGRDSKNAYVQSDICSYEPGKRFDVILFRDSIYYIPRTQIKSVLNRYSNYLNFHGVFIVRMWDGKNRFRQIEELIKSNFEVVDTYLSEQPNALIMVFRGSS